MNFGIVKVRLNFVYIYTFRELFNQYKKRLSTCISTGDGHLLIQGEDPPPDNNVSEDLDEGPEGVGLSHSEQFSDSDTNTVPS